MALVVSDGGEIPMWYAAESLEAVRPYARGELERHFEAFARKAGWETRYRNSAHPEPEIRVDWESPFFWEH